MTKLRQLATAVVLTFMLATYGFAGIIPTVPGPDPAPEAPQAAPTGITDTPPNGAYRAVVPADPVLDFALHLLQSALLAF